MHIHSVKKDESLSDIARAYGVSADTIIINNEIKEPPAIGEELLILTPTRTHTLRAGDTPERIMLRFGISRRALQSNNPQLSTVEPGAGDTLIIKYSEPRYGMGASNGSFYKGCSIEALKRALPYLTYVTVASVALDREHPKMLFDDGEPLRLSLEADKIPLLRAYDRFDNRDYTDEKTRERLADEMIRLATDKKYKGIVLSRLPEREGVGDFILTLRKKMIGCDLILLTEVDENSPDYMSELADGSIYYYNKCGESKPESYESGERRAYEAFAHGCESAKTMLELPTFAYSDGGYVPLVDVLSLARRRRYEIRTDKSTLLSDLDAGKRKYVFPSLSNIKATLDAVAEYGFMGVSVDIMRTPIAYLTMYNALFKPAIYTSVRAREGCSRES